MIGLGDDDCDVFLLPFWEVCQRNTCIEDFDDEGTDGRDDFL